MGSLHNRIIVNNRASIGTECSGCMVPTYKGSDYIYFLIFGEWKPALG